MADGRSLELAELGAKLGELRAGFVGSAASGLRSQLPDLSSHAVTISISTDQARPAVDATKG